MGGGQPPKTIIYPQEIMDIMDIKDFVVENWKNAEKLKTLLGAEFDETEEFKFGFASAREKARIEVTNGKISRIITWSGLGLTQCGYSDPIVDIGDRCLYW